MKLKLNRKFKQTLVAYSVMCVAFTFIFSFFDHKHWNGIDEQEDSDLSKRIFNRFYFVTTTISTVGYGDISPKSYVCKCLVSLLQMFILLEIFIIAAF